MASGTRLFKELREIQKEKEKMARRGEEEDIALLPNEQSIYLWRAVVKGPDGTPFEGGRFKLKITCSEQYPLVPPKVEFVTKVFHPNVHFKTGEICLDILKTAWSPAWTLQSVCRAVIALLSHPEADSPLNCDCGNLIRSGDQRGYWSMARMYTLEHAVPASAGLAEA
mmetsp:Transcript_4060/g.14527  ORF Transcript_4060/g.14527 Transcript_4060/m.14527 type:complete len:168 (+) Transcript_4060:240-743(+)